MAQTHSPTTCDMFTSNMGKELTLTECLQNHRWQNNLNALVATEINVLVSILKSNVPNHILY